jgi:hypothetical protein
LRINAGVSKLSPAFALVVLWQARQLFRKIGKISLSKSTTDSRFNSATGRPGLAGSAPETTAEGTRASESSVVDHTRKEFRRPRGGRE